MDLGSRIKQHRTAQGLSQEELAREIYVSRQTVSNWETDRTYPDVESLLLLSALFDVSIDDLVRGDVDMLKDTMERHEKELGLWGTLCIACAGVTLLLLAGGPLLLGSALAAFAASIIPCIATFYAVWRTQRIMKDLDVETTAEMVAFLEGKPIDRDEAKRRQFRRQVKIIGAIVTVFGACIGACMGLMAYKAGF